MEMDSNKNKQSTETGQLLSAALDLGEQMLICGGEVNRVEDTICRLCKAYGAKKVDVFSITTCIKKYLSVSNRFLRRCIRSSK